MNKKQQIEEMGDIIYENSEADTMWPEIDAMAMALYDAGYRKQREGEWLDKPTGAYCRTQSWCSACGKHSGIGGIESNRHKPYCPNCGAKMKGENNDKLI